MPDTFANLATGYEAPATDGFAITPNDGTPLADVPRWVYVGGAGNIVLRLRDDVADITLTAVPVGSLLPIRPTFIRATGTTATNLVALY